jgi:hypothetical protein
MEHKLVLPEGGGEVSDLPTGIHHWLWDALGSIKSAAPEHLSWPEVSVAVCPGMVSVLVKVIPWCTAFYRTVDVHCEFNFFETGSCYVTQAPAWASQVTEITELSTQNCVLPYLAIGVKFWAETYEVFGVAELPVHLWVSILLSHTALEFLAGHIDGLTKHKLYSQFPL